MPSRRGRAVAAGADDEVPSAGSRLAATHRVAVLSQGRLQQCATPRELYDSPVNQFVAGFIGSPAMNLQTVPITEGGARVANGSGELAGEVVLVEELGADALSASPRRPQRGGPSPGRRFAYGPAHLGRSPDRARRQEGPLHPGGQEEPAGPVRPGQEPALAAHPGRLPPAQPGPWPPCATWPSAS